MCWNDKALTEKSRLKGDDIMYGMSLVFSNIWVNRQHTVEKISRVGEFNNVLCTVFSIHKENFHLVFILERAVKTIYF